MKVNLYWTLPVLKYLYECMSGFKKFKEELPSKERFYSLLMGKIFTNKEYEHVLKV